MQNEQEIRHAITFSDIRNLCALGRNLKVTPAGHYYERSLIHAACANPRG